MTNQTQTTERTFTDEEFAVAFAAFFHKLEKRVEQYIEDHGYRPEIIGTLAFKKGHRYFKIMHVRHGKNAYVHSFVDTKTGDILKPATWKAPAKHARGNIFSPQNGMEALHNGYFVRYLK